MAKHDPRASQDHPPRDEILGGIRDMSPVLRNELVVARHDLLLHATTEGLGGRLGVERWIPSQHYVDQYPQTPHVTALWGKRVGSRVINSPSARRFKMSV